MYIFELIKKFYIKVVGTTESKEVRLTKSEATGLSKLFYTRGDYERAYTMLNYKEDFGSPRVMSVANNERSERITK